jgi:hypothetical protein
LITTTAQTTAVDAALTEIHNPIRNRPGELSACIASAELASPNRVAADPIPRVFRTDICLPSSDDVAAANDADLL